MKYFVGMELGVANFLQRHFDWSSNCLWYEEIPNARDPKKTKFFLGGRDDIVDAQVCFFLARAPHASSRKEDGVELIEIFFHSESRDTWLHTGSVMVCCSIPKVDTVKPSLLVVKATKRFYDGYVKVNDRISSLPLLFQVDDPPLWTVQLSSCIRTIHRLLDVQKPKFLTIPRMCMNSTMFRNTYVSLLHPHSLCNFLWLSTSSEIGFCFFFFNTYPSTHTTKTPRRPTLPISKKLVLLYPCIPITYPHIYHPTTPSTSPPRSIHRSR